MQKLEFNFSHEGSITPDKVDIGHDGDHNATTLVFLPDDIIKSGTEYYRLFIDGFSSEPLYLKENKVEFKIPNGVLKPGVQHIQVKCYNQTNGIVSMILCSDIITASTDYSLDEGIEIPEDLRADVTTLKKELSDLVNDGKDIEETVLTAAEIAKTSAEIAKSSKDTAVDAAERATHNAEVSLTSKEEVARNTQTVLSSTKDALVYMENTRSASLDAQQAERAAEDYKNIAINAAATMEDVAHRKEVLSQVKTLYFDGDVKVYSDFSSIGTKFAYNEADGSIGGYYFNYFSRPFLFKPNTKYKVRVEKYIDFTEIGDPLYIFSAERPHTEQTPPILEITSVHFDIDNYEYTSFEFTTPHDYPENMLVFIGGKFQTEMPIKKNYQVSIVEESVAKVYTKEEIDNKLNELDIPETDLSNYYTKPEVDDMVGNIETVLDNIIAIQNTLIGGEG